MPDAGWRATLCPYCGVGCGLLVAVEDGRVARVKGDPAHPSSLGDVCAKAVHLPPTLRTPDRLLYPQVRARRGTPLERVPWELALRSTAERLRAVIDEHGPAAVALYASGQLTTEEYYVAGKLARGFIGTNNFDTNSRLCMASAAIGYARSFGADGPPCSYDDLDAADCFFLVGTNTADCHPVLFKRLRRRKLAAPDEVFVIVADPRWTETADLADLHLALRPGSDIALLNGMLHVLRREGRLTASSSRATRSNGRRWRSDRGLSAGTGGGADRVCPPRPSSWPPGGSVTPGPRSRCGAWASTRATPAPTRTRRSSTCIWPRGRSGARARARFP